MYNDLINKGIIKAYNLKKDDDIKSVECIEKIYLKDITIKKEELEILKNIKSTIKTLTTIVLDNVVFEDNNIFVDIENLEIINIKLEDLNLENVKVSNSLKLVNTDIDSLNQIIKFNNISNLHISQGQVVSTDLDKILIKVLPDYPRFDYMDKEEKNDILLKYDCYEKKCTKINLENLDKFENLTSIYLDGFVIIDDNIRELIKKEKLEVLSLKGELRKNLETLTNLTNLKKLEFKSFEYTTLVELNKFLHMPNLKELVLEKINKVEDFLVKENKIVKLKAIDCNITRIDFLIFFSNIKDIDFSNNKIDIGVQDEILSYIRKGVKFNINNNPILDKLKTVKLKFKENTLNLVLTKALKLDENKELTEFDLFNKTIENDILCINLKEVADILDNKIHLKLNLKDIEIYIDEDKDLNKYATMLYEFSQNLTLITDNLASIGILSLEKLNHIKIRNKIDIKIKIAYDEKDYYTLESYEYMLNKLNIFINNLKITRNPNRVLVYNEEKLTKENLITILNDNLSKMLIFNENCKITIENGIVEEYANNKLYEILIDKLIKYIYIDNT